jgi:hypothetical protein
MQNIVRDSPRPADIGEEEDGVNKEGGVDVSADPAGAGPSVVGFQCVLICAFSHLALTCHAKHCSGLSSPY